MVRARLRADSWSKGGVFGQSSSQPGDALSNRRPVGVAGNDHLHGLNRRVGEVSFENDEPLPRRHRSGQRRDTGGAEIYREVKTAENGQYRDRKNQIGHRAVHDASGQPIPEASRTLKGGTARGGLLEKWQPQGVHLVAQGSEQRGQQGESSEQGGKHSDNGARGHTVE